MRTDQHVEGDQLVDMVVSMAPNNNELSFLTLTNAKSYKNPIESGTSDCSDAIFSPKFE